MKIKDQNNLTKLSEHVAIWMMNKHARYHGLKSIPKKSKLAFHTRAENLITAATKNKSLSVLEIKGSPIALISRTSASMPRVKNQQGILIIYNEVYSRVAKTWLRGKIKELALLSPRFTQVYLSPVEDSHFGNQFNKAGFNTRYEILQGETKIAYKNLMAKKVPPANLDHLGLKIIPLTKKSELTEVMKLQKKIALKSRRHTYFAHTPAQLKKDKEEYAEIIANKSGLILGIYKKEKLLGIMLAGIHKEALNPIATGGFSFFLDHSIQGLGISKTGYRLLLEYLIKNKIKKFYGGTSQPAIQSLGKIMNRKVQMVIYLKMT